MFVKAVEASKYYNVKPCTLRKWARQGIIQIEKTIGGKYHYWIGEETAEAISSEVLEDHIIYARVSSHKQKPNLYNQIYYLKEKYPNYTLVTDIGSGINYKRKGFKSILERLIKGGVRKVVVANQDRWSRFSFSFFQWLFEQYNAVLESVGKYSKEGEDIVTDLLEIITVFTARYHGRRRYNSEEDEVVSEPDSEVSI